MLVPKLAKPSQISFINWQHKYHDDVNEILQTIDADIMHFFEKNEGYDVKINYEKLNDALIRFIYNNSSSKNRTFQFLK